MTTDYLELCAERLNLYRTVAVYARAFIQAVDAGQEDWEHAMRDELNTALARARSKELEIDRETKAAA
jgi:hypothetical protein